MARRSRVVVAMVAGSAAWVWVGGLSTRAGVIMQVPTPAGSMDGTTANAINATGTVTGAYFDANANEIAYTYSPRGGFTSLPLSTAGGTALAFTVGNGVNAAGTVVGQANDADGNVFPFRYTTAGGLTPLGTPTYAGSTYSGGPATAINGAGTAVGWTNVTLANGDFTTHAVVFQNGTATDVTPTLDDPLGIGSELLAVNAAGAASGYEAVATGGTGLAAATQHAVVYANGKLTDLTPTLVSGSTSSTEANAEATAINAAGLVAGTTFQSMPGSRRGATVIAAQAYRYTAGTNGYTGIALAPAPGQTSSVAAGLDTAGDAVGYSYGGGANDDATLWVAGSTVGTDLNAFLARVDPADAPDWILEQASGINDAGQIVGFGMYSPTGAPASGYQAAFILDASSLTAVPEPTGLAAAASSVGVALLARRRRRAIG